MQRGTNGAPEEPSADEQLRALVTERGAALREGDVRAYSSTASGPQRRRDRRAARRAARLPLRDVSLEVRSVTVEGERARLRVTHEYAVAGIRGTYRTTRRLRAVSTGDGWRIRSNRAGRGQPPWEVAAFSARRTRHFVVLAPRGLAVDDLLTTLEAGYERMRALLTRGNLRRRYLVVVAADAAQARELTVQIRGVQALAAISDAAIREQGPEREVTAVMSLRLLVVWPAFTLLTAEGRSRVITHELTHAALAGATSGRTPAWLAEGVALYVSGDRRPAPADPDLAALSRPDAIALRTGEEQAAAYAASSAAAFAIAERYGRRRLLRLYDAFGEPTLKGNPGRRLVNRALRRELGIGLAELEASLG